MEAGKGGKNAQGNDGLAARMGSARSVQRRCDSYSSTSLSYKNTEYKPKDHDSRRQEKDVFAIPVSCVGFFNLTAIFFKKVII